MTTSDNLFRVFGCSLAVACEFRFRVLGFGFRVLGLGFRDWGFGLRVLGLEFLVLGLGLWVQGSGFLGLGFRVQSFVLETRQLVTDCSA